MKAFSAPARGRSSYFWRMTAANPRATYACLDLGQAAAPREIQKQSICIDGDIGAVLAALKD